MARCGCSGSTGCSCRISEGDGILISGSGSPTDPFVITAEVTSFAASFLVQDTNSVDLTLFGTGTTADPFILSASSTLGMTQLSDWYDPAGPVTGDVATFDGANWTAAPVGVSPGTIFANTGITGNGTVGTPLKVAVSDTTTTSTSGTAIYVDSAGKLRAVPGAASVAWTDITGKPTTFVAAWADVTGKPTTFTPTIGTTAVTAKAGNWFPAWTDVTGRPANTPTTIDNTVADVAAASASASGAKLVRWDAAGRIQAVGPVNPLDVANKGYVDTIGAGFVAAFGDNQTSRYTRGPDATAYARTVAGAGFFAVWMDNGNQFGRNVSARKYKTDIEEYAVSVEDVYALKPVKYTLISSPEAGEQYGLIADDVAMTLPEIVTFEDGEPETIRYDLLAVALLDVVKDLNARIEALEAH